MGPLGLGNVLRAKYPFVYCLAVFRFLSPNFIRSRFQYQVFPMLFTVVHFVSLFAMRLNYSIRCETMLISLIL